MDVEKRTPPSHLFTVRIWREETSQGMLVWRGKVQHVSSGERRYFREWDWLMTFLQNKVDTADSQEELGNE